MKVAVASGKGGTGKTTLSVNLASYIAGTRPVVLTDLDVEEPNSGSPAPSSVPLGTRFDRTEYILIYDEAEGSYTGHDNREVDSVAHGAYRNSQIGGHAPLSPERLSPRRLLGLTHAPPGAGGRSSATPRWYLTAIQVNRKLPCSCHDVYTRITVTLHEDIEQLLQEERSKPFQVSARAHRAGLPLPPSAY